MRLLLASLLLLAPSAAPADAPFAITVVDDQTGRGVPLVELRTVNDIRYITDSQGVVAFDEPGLLGQRVFFHVGSHGYEFPKDGFGIRGTALDTVPGGSATLKLRRLNIAERLYRVTGQGIYRDSLLVGRPAPTRQPLLNGLVTGSDSVVNALYRGKLHWFWGDTNRPAYPLGNFHVPGATSLLPADGGLPPEVGIDLTYFLDDAGFARPTAQMPGDGPTWIDGLTVLAGDADAAGEPGERMFCAYVKVRPPLTVYRRGLAEWDDAEARFRHVADIPLDAPLYPRGHPFPHTDDGVHYVYFANPYPLVRVAATPEAFLDLARYEGFTCLLPAGAAAAHAIDDNGPSGENIQRIDRDAACRPRFAWRRGAAPLGPDEQARLIKDGLLSADDAWPRLRDRESGAAVAAHRGSVYWNDYRRRFVMITVEQKHVEQDGMSPLGEVWYAEADAPQGPWTDAVKIVTHDRYSFYNPKQHPQLDQDGGRLIHFEGTYTTTFSGNSHPTPRYDYNQIMYRLDLSDPRLRTAQ